MKEEREKESCMHRKRNSHQPYTFEWKMSTYLEDVLLQNLRDGQSMLSILSSNYCQIADLKAHVGGEVFQGKAVILRYLGSVRRHFEVVCR